MNIITLLSLIFLLPAINCLNYSADNLNILFYKTYTDFQLIKPSACEKILEQDYFNSSRKTAFFVPGVDAVYNSPNIQPIFELLIKSRLYNVIHLDHNYYTSVRGPSLYEEIIYLMGETFGNCISKLMSLGLRRESIEIIGHSYGCDLGTVIANYTKPQIPIFVALEPDFMRKFYKGFTDITIALHTAMGFIGDSHFYRADANIIANNGVMQPSGGNPDVTKLTLKEQIDAGTYSHLVALQYWGYMVTNPELFFGVECDFYKCNYDRIVQLGPNLSPGLYYIKTSSTPPYGLGLDGVKNITLVDFELINYGTYATYSSDYGCMKTKSRNDV